MLMFGRNVIQAGVVDGPRLAPNLAAEDVAAARVITIPATGHLSALESSRAVADIIIGAPSCNAGPHHA